MLANRLNPWTFYAKQSLAMRPMPARAQFAELSTRASGTQLLGIAPLLRARADVGTPFGQPWAYKLGTFNVNARLRSTWYQQPARRPSRSSVPKPAAWEAPARKRTLPNFNNFFDEKPNYIIYAIIGISTAVFLAWQYAMQNARQFGDFRLLKFMRENFLCDWHGVRSGRWWTLITSTFSHNEMWHFGLNMFVLHSFGSTVIQTISARLFAQLYLLSGVASSVAGLLYYRLIDRRSNATSHGASGSITAVTAVFASIYPTATIMVMFFPMVSNNYVELVARYMLTRCCFVAGVGRRRRHDRVRLLSRVFRHIGSYQHCRTLGRCSYRFLVLFFSDQALPATVARESRGGMIGAFRFLRGRVVRCFQSRCCV